MPVPRNLAVELARNVVDLFATAEERLLHFHLQVESLEDTHGFRFGVEDESGKINLNVLPEMEKLDPTGNIIKDIVSKLQVLEMTPEQADSIMNWMRPQGATALSFISL